MAKHVRISQINPEPASWKFLEKRGTLDERIPSQIVSV